MGKISLRLNSTLVCKKVEKKTHINQNLPRNNDTQDRMSRQGHQNGYDNISCVQESEEKINTLIH